MYVCMYVCIYSINGDKYSQKKKKKITKTGWIKLKMLLAKQIIAL